MFNFFFLLSQAKVRVTAWVGAGLGATCHHFPRQHPWGGHQEHQEWRFLVDKVPEHTTSVCPVIQDTTERCRIHHLLACGRTGWEM